MTDFKPLPAHGRYPSTPIGARAKGRWPNGRGLAVYIALNLEQYAWGEGLVEDLVPGIPAPDVLNNSWREYGNRVGAWRLHDLLQGLQLPALRNAVTAQDWPAGAAVLGKIRRLVGINLLIGLLVVAIGAARPLF